MVAIRGSSEVMVRQYHKTRSAGVNMAIRHVQTVFLAPLPQPFMQPSYSNPLKVLVWPQFQTKQFPIV